MEESFNPIYIMKENDLERYLEFDSKLIARQHIYYYKSVGYRVLKANNIKVQSGSVYGLYIRRSEEDIDLKKIFLVFFLIYLR